MLPKAHLTSHSGMSGCKWVTTPLWLSGSLKPFLYSSFVCSCHLFLVSPASVRSLLFLSFIIPILAWNVLFLSATFLKRSLVFPFLLFSSISLYCSTRRLSHLSLLVSLTLLSWVYISLTPLLFTSLPSSAIYKAPSDNHFTFMHFFFFGMFLDTAYHTMLQTSVHNSSALCPPDLVIWIYGVTRVRHNLGIKNNKQ